MKKVLLYDISNLSMRCLHAFKPRAEETEFKEYKTTFINSFLKTIAEHSPDKVICCMDSTSWRKDICTDYKANRLIQREKSIINFEAFYKVSNRLVNLMKECFQNIQFLEVPKCEADDLIAIITKNNPDWEIINVSTDHDFYQLFKYPNYKQYDGKEHKFVETLNGEQQLLLKIILGDKSDNIPQLKKGCGIKTAQTLVNEGLDEWLEKNNLREAFDSNMKLISFDCIPAEFTEKVLTEINSFEPKELDINKFWKMVFNEGLADLMQKATPYIECLKRIN